VRAALLILACSVALVTASGGTSAPAAVETRSCSQLGADFNVQVAGNIDGTYWGRMHRDLFAPIGRGEAMVAVWTFGSQQNLDSGLYGWAAGSRADIADRCRALRALKPARGSLRPALRVKDGWAFGKRYECSRRGRIVIQTDEARGRTRVAVWMERSRELIALAEVRSGNAWLRASKRCDERDL
jgi:hypothetical protein